MRRASSQGRLLSLLRQVGNQVDMRYKNLREAFRRIDLDASGYLSRQEVEFALQMWRIPVKDTQVDALMAEFDTDGDSLVSFSEWCSGLKQATTPSKAVFGRGDQHVTDRYRVLGDGQVLINDNLSATPRPNEPRSAGRPDFRPWNLPRSDKPASPTQIEEASRVLQDQIYVKFKLIRDAFRSFDKDKDGKLSHAELLSAVRCFNLSIPEQHVLQLAKQCDRDGNGYVDYDEFAAALKRKDALGN